VNLMGTVLLLALIAATPAGPGPRARPVEELRIDGLASRPPDPILVFVLRGDGVKTPLLVLQERARQALEQHLNARVVSAEEAFVGGGSEFQQKLAECRADDRCYARLVGTVEANYLLVMTARKLGELVLLGARFLDLRAVRALGNAADPVPAGTDLPDAIEARIRAAIPPEMWDPFGRLHITSDLEGAEIAINGRLVGVTPLPPIGHLLPGIYRLAAARGDARQEASARVVRGEEATATLVLTPPKVEETSNAWLWWVVAGVAVVGAGVGIAAIASGGGSPTFCSAVEKSLCK
jgi:hypothetical protein